METPSEGTAVKLTLGGAWITLAPHPLNPARPGCVLSLVMEGLLLAVLWGLHLLGVGFALEALYVILISTGILMWPLAGTLLGVLLSRAVGRSDIRLKLTTAVLTRIRPAPLEIPLDSIEAVELLQERWRPLRPWAVEVVLRGGTRERIGWALREDEARWLVGSLREAVARRRAALAAAGHPLAEGAEIPAALRAVQERTQ